MREIKIKEVSVKKLVDIVFDNWGVEDKELGDSTISTILSMLGDNGSSGTGNMKGFPSMRIYKPFIPMYGDEEEPEFIGIFTISECEYELLVSMGFYSISHWIEEKWMKDDMLSLIDHSGRITRAMYEEDNETIEKCIDLWEEISDNEYNFSKVDFVKFWKEIDSNKN